MGKNNQYTKKPKESPLQTFRLKKEILNQVDRDIRLKTELAFENGRSSFTIQEWIRTNSPLLTTAKNLWMIKKGLGLHDGFIIIDMPKGSPAIENAMIDPVLMNAKIR